MFDLVNRTNSKSMKANRSNFMYLIKKPLVYFLIPVVAFFIGYISIIVLQKSEEAERDAEEREGIPSVLKQMDLWSDMRTYPNKTMDASAFTRSYEIARAMAIAEEKNGINTNSITATPWTALAPMNFSGRILSIGFHPTDANTMWVGSASGGLWKTTNGGTGGAGGINWQYVPTGFPVLGVSSIAVNPSAATEIYIGTGEVYSSVTGGSTGAGHIRTFRGSYGIGILKSTNGGLNWTKTLDFSSSSLKGVMDLAINPTTPSTVFAATTDGIYRTTNSGGSWTLIHNIPYAMDLCFKPGNSNILYVGSGNFQSAGTGIYKTTNANAATPVFSQLTSANLPNPISGKIQLAISAANPSRVYASIGRDPNSAHTQGLYVSTDEGATWAAAGAANILANQGWYAHDVAVSPSDANRVLWGELDTYLSTNGGASAAKTGSWNLWDVNNTTVGDLTEGVSNSTGYVHADVHRIAVSPHDATGNTFFLCTDGGLFRTTNGGSNFNTLNGGLNTAQIYANMAVHPTNANYMLLGLQDNEAMVYEGNAGCRRIGSLGDGFHAAMNFDGTIQFVESYYFSYRRSINSGTSFAGGSGAVPEVACFNVPMVFSKAASSTYMFAGTVYFKRSTNSGSTWTNLNGGAAIAGNNNPVIAMVAPTNDIVYFSTAPDGAVRSKLWKTTNATSASPTFTEITGTLPDRYYSSIEVDPVDPNRLFVTLSGFGSPHMYMSVNGGSTWSNLSTGLPDVPHNAVFVNPSARGQVYIGSDLGVFVANGIPLTGPLGATTPVFWNSFNSGLGDAVMVSDILVTNTAKLRLGTYGRGLWETDLASLTLPIVLKQFKAWPVDKGNRLQWIVSGQTDIKQFEIESSANGSQFSKIATIPPSVATVEKTYNYLHENVPNADMFYRIKSVENDDSYSYSSIELVKAQRLITKVSAYPNPTTGVFNLRIAGQVNQPIDIKVYNSGGSLVMEKNYANNQNNSYQIDISSFPNGTYQVICEGAKGRWTATVLKK